MKAVIGITCDIQEAVKEEAKYFLRQAYVKAVIVAGGLPLLLPNLPADLVDKCLDILSGIIFSGGGDVAPNYFGQQPSSHLGRVEPQRDASELLLAKVAWERRLPMLGICRGMQVVNIALGGNIWQDLQEVPGPVLQHDQDAPFSYPSHEVILEPGCFGNLIKAKKLMVNSFHHQSVKEVGQGLIVTARSSDGIIEALEAKAPDQCCLCLQWHPEWLLGPAGQGCFDILLEAAKGYGANVAKIRR